MKLAPSNFHSKLQPFGCFPNYQSYIPVYTLPSRWNLLNYMIREFVLFFIQFGLYGRMGDGISTDDAAANKKKKKQQTSDVLMTSSCEYNSQIIPSVTNVY